MTTDSADNTRLLFYAEDDPTNLRLVEEVIRHQSGWQLVTTPRGDQAMDMIRQHQPDLVLLDIELPGMNGTEILEQIRSLSELAGIPVVAVSGSLVEDTLRGGARFDGYLAKPFPLTSFVALLERFEQ